MVGAGVMVAGWKSAAVMVVVMVMMAAHHGVHTGGVHGGGVHVIGRAVSHGRQSGHGGGRYGVQHLEAIHAVVTHLKQMGEVRENR